jgi:uncharacterized membrane protein YfcA|tara:strand:+ start:134339 stop:134542 length:204 start_codon:yes stop_codon:yes gene_type:complete
VNTTSQTPQLSNALIRIRSHITLALLTSPGTLLAAEGIQANPKRWLLIFPVAVVLLVIILIRKTRHK